MFPKNTLADQRVNVTQAVFLLHNARHGDRTQLQYALTTDLMHFKIVT